MTNLKECPDATGVYLSGARARTRIPLGDTELGSYLENEYSMFDLIVHEDGAITFTLKLNDVLDRVLESVAWSYAKLLVEKRK